MRLRGPIWKRFPPEGLGHPSGGGRTASAGAAARRYAPHVPSPRPHVRRRCSGAPHPPSGRRRHACRRPAPVAPARPSPPGRDPRGARREL